MYVYVFLDDAFAISLGSLFPVFVILTAKELFLQFYLLFNDFFCCRYFFFIMLTCM